MYTIVNTHIVGLSLIILLTEKIRPEVAKEWENKGYTFEAHSDKPTGDNYHDNTGLEDCDWYYTSEELNKMAHEIQDTGNNKPNAEIIADIEIILNTYNMGMLTARECVLQIQNLTVKSNDSLIQLR